MLRSPGRIRSRHQQQLERLGVPPLEPVAGPGAIHDDDPSYIAVDLEFDIHDEADAFKTALETVWRSPQAAPALGGTPRARIVDVVETRQY